MLDIHQSCFRQEEEEEKVEGLKKKQKYILLNSNLSLRF